MTDTERLAFEKWYREEFGHSAGSFHDGNYVGIQSHGAWKAWQARPQDSRCVGLLLASKNVNDWLEITGYANGPMKERLTKAIAAFEASHEK